MSGRLLFYAPNVHTGGGLVLLQALLAEWPADLPMLAWLDARARDQLQLPWAALVHWVQATPLARLGGEVSLARQAVAGDRVLCFHGLPPLLPNAAENVVFLQNMHYLGNIDLSESTRWVRWRQRFEQTLFRLGRGRVAAYWVQTPTMARGLHAWWPAMPMPVNVLPYALPIDTPTTDAGKRWDFVYVADGEPHKNHRKLVEAWKLLADEGLHPTLALTLPARNSPLSQWVRAQAQRHGLRIDDVGFLPHAEVMALYGQAGALIFPSRGESFGLPLFEARELGLPILASERDYVRDVCHPVQTFDPESALSIARAVKRFLGTEATTIAPVSGAEFLQAVAAGARRQSDT
jgi:glycosyltransferase involved in cell wall biosynthesis